MTPATKLHKMLCFLSVSHTLSLWRYPHLKGFLGHCYRWSSLGEVRWLVHDRAGTRSQVFCLLPSPEIQRRNPSLWDFQGLYPPVLLTLLISQRHDAEHPSDSLGELCKYCSSETITPGWLKIFWREDTLQGIPVCHQGWETLGWCLRSEQLGFVTCPPTVCPELYWG